MSNLELGPGYMRFGRVPSWSRSLPFLPVLKGSGSESLEERVARLEEVIARIGEMADEELERIEKHGGCAGFPLRVRLLVGGAGR